MQINTTKVVFRRSEYVYHYKIKRYIMNGVYWKNNRKTDKKTPESGAFLSAVELAK